MNLTSNHSTQQPIDTVIHGDCIDVMSRMQSGSVDMILTDPPYITRYRSRDGGLPPSGGPGSMLVHDGCCRYGRGGRRSWSGLRSRPQHSFRRGRFVAQR